MSTSPNNATHATNAKNSQEFIGRQALRQVFQSADLRRLLPWLSISALLSNSLAVVLPMAILQIMDRVVSSQSLDTLFFLVAGILVAIFLEEVLRSMNGLITSWLGARFEHNMAVRALDHVMHVPLALYQRQEAGTYAEKILASSRVAEFYSGQALLVMFDLPFSLLFLTLIFLIGGPLVFVPLILLCVFSLLVVRFARVLRALVVERQKLDERRFSFLEEVLANILSVKVLAMESLLQRRYERLEEANAEMGEKLTHANNVASSMGMVFSQMMIVSIIFAGALLVIAGNMTPGALSACMMLSVRALQPLNRSLAVWLRYQLFIEAQQRLDQVLQLPSESSAEKATMPPLASAVQLQDISLSHGASAPLLRDINLRINAGECIVIAGESGSGKSSLLALMNGLIAPSSGQVLVDDVPLTKFNLSSAHQEMALLAQTSTIFSGSVLENMTMYTPALNSEAQKISIAIGLDRIVSAMPLGYETMLVDGVADMMPEGVRQLICVVRVMVRHPSVLLFDEANTSLDLASDKRLQDYLASIVGKLTMVLVTHRPSLAALANRHFKLVDGQLIDIDQEAALSVAAPVPEAVAATIAPIAVTPEVSKEVSKEGTKEVNNEVTKEGAKEVSKEVAKEVAKEVPIDSRPPHEESLDEFLRRQFERHSDFSLCIAPLLQALHWQENRRELSEAMPHLANQLDLSGLCVLMANLQWQAHSFQSSLKRLDSRLLPCLYVPEQSAALVIIEALPNGNWRAFDSALQEERELSTDDTPVQCLVFRHGEIEHLTPANQSWISQLFWRSRYQVMLAFALSVLATILALAAPIFVSSMYDRVIPTGDAKLGSLLILGVGLTMMLEWKMRGLRSRIMAYFGGRSEYLLGISIFDHVISLQASASDGVSVTRQVGRIKNLESLRDVFLGPLALLAFELPTTLILLAAIAFISPWLTVVVLVSAMLFTLLGFVSHRFGNAIAGNAATVAAKRNEFLNEALTNMRAIRSSGAESFWVSRFRELSGIAVLAGYYSSRRHALFNSIGQILGVATGVITLAVSAILAINGLLTGGAMIAAMMIVWRLVGPMQSIFNAGMSIVKIRTTMRQIENLMHLRGERDDGVRQAIRPAIDGNLSFIRVSFRYANDADPALLGINLRLEFGKIFVIAGPNGSGKSTMLKLVARLYQPQAGQIRLDNADIRQLSATDLRSRISYMPQQCEIFYGTVAQNLRLVHPHASDAEVAWAVQMAGLQHDIELLPQGMQTRISNSRSEQLPNGFRQRLSLARTMLKPTCLVLLDEPGKGMDQLGEEALMRCLEYLRGKATVIMVSHRPGHMRSADVVICMENGAIVAAGTFDQVKDRILGGKR